jgi:LysR family glycine cleavage system transcriptional activator
MRRRLPPLSSLKLFEASARLLSFKNAAEELLLTPSAVSHGIQSLEEWLGVPLFLRTTRGLVLSEAGADYLPVVAAALDTIAAGSARISSRRGSGVLAISVAPTFATRWLLPRLHEFQARHPEIEVVIDTSLDRAVLNGSEAKVAIRMGRGNWQGLVSDLVMRETLIPVCSPTIRKRVEVLDDIGKAPLIHATSPSVEWVEWAKNAGRSGPDLRKSLHVDTIQMAFEAACQGLGVALGRRPLVDVELSDGRLVEIWGSPLLTTTGYWLVSSEEATSEPRIMAFRNWMREQLPAPPASATFNVNAHSKMLRQT